MATHIDTFDSSSAMPDAWSNDAPLKIKDMPLGVTLVFVPPFPKRARKLRVEPVNPPADTLPSPPARSRRLR
jgi:hypothetical protein